MKKLLAHLSVGVVCYHLVDVHICLSSRARLPYYERKMLVKLARDYFLAGRADCRELFGSHSFGTKLGVSLGRCELEQGKRADDLDRHQLKSCADAEVIKAALSLSAPKAILAYLNVSHRVVFNSVFHKYRTSFLSKNPRLA